MEVTFLTPAGALLALAVVVPLGALALVERRARRARAALRLQPPPARALLPVPLALGGVAALLAFAAAQPVLRDEHRRYARTDAEAIFAFDTSRSMLAAGSPRGRARLQRARAIAKRLRSAIADVPAGAASFTDRALPHLFPSSDSAAFVATVDRAIGVERPPPRGNALTATTFDALAGLPRLGYFTPGVRRRLLIVLTDGESRDFSAARLRRSFSPRRGLTTIVVRVSDAGERVFGPEGLPEPDYRPSEAGSQTLERLLAATGAHAFAEHEVGRAARAARAALGTGPRTRVASAPGTTALAPFLVLGAFAPLALLLWYRNS